MPLYSAIIKIAKMGKSKSYYNSDYILTVKEKQTLVAFGFFIVFPIVIGLVTFLAN